MTPGTRPERRAARAAPFPARSRASARMVTMSAIEDSSLAPRTRAQRAGFTACDAGLQGCRASRRCRIARAAEIPFLVEQARNRALLADAADRLGHQRRDAELADVLRHSHRLGRQ